MQRRDYSLGLFRFSSMPVLMGRGEQGSKSCPVGNRLQGSGWEAQAQRLAVEHTVTASYRAMPRGWRLSAQ